MKPRHNNPNSRAIVSALRSDIPAMRAAAAREVDKAIGKRKSMSPRDAVMSAFGASRNTAAAILDVRDELPPVWKLEWETPLTVERLLRVLKEIERTDRDPHNLLWMLIEGLEAEDE